MLNQKYLKTMLTLMLLSILISCTGEEGKVGDQSRIKIIDNLFLLSNSTGSPELQIAGDLLVTDLQIIDIEHGYGNAEVSLSNTLEVYYLGVGANAGFVFDSSYARNESAQFPLAAVIKGWQEGLIGIREGGRRVLIIPANQAYGATPPPGSGIESNEALIFVIDLIKIL